MPRRPPSPTKHSPQASSRKPASASSTSEVVHPLWLIKALGAIFLAAIACGYLTLCLLFYQGQWQLVLHPKRSADRQVAIDGTPVQFFSFAPDESATPQVTGWLIAAAPGSRYAQTTLLYLRGSDGSLADDISALTILHSLGINVFALDYRGYGQSATGHPSQRKMAEDAESAWQYLRTSRKLSETEIVPYGVGIGASLATQLALNHPMTPAIILEAPKGDLLDTVRNDPRTNLVPLRLLFHERFALAAPLASLKTPKLFLLTDDVPKISPTGDFQAITGAASPKIMAHLHAADLNGPVYREQITRFLDEFLPSTPGSPLVTPATPAVAKRP